MHWLLNVTCWSANSNIRGFKGHGRDHYSVPVVFWDEGIGHGVLLAVLFRECHRSNGTP